MLYVHSHPCFLTPKRLQPELPLFVFLPGMDGTGRLLRAQTAGLESAFDVRCLSIPTDDLTHWQVLTETVVALIEAELEPSPDRPVYLCGESFGGCLAMKVALAAPQLFDRLILVNPASSFHRKPLIAWGSQVTRWLPEFAYRLSSIALMPFLAYLGRVAEGDRQAFYDAVLSVPQKTSIWRLSLLGDFDVTNEQLSQLQQPVLLLASAADRLLPSLAEVQHLELWFPNAQVFVLPYSGHACLLEADVNLYEIMKVQNFLTDLTERSQDLLRSR
ncbi:alpha/beta fold hydrolase [Stenomitos frigidus]|uniref:Alpha/beta hydrolase n=1 Tax=Stenomitos frigidus ULC18 TaxID=2107698 RepID=A0A2T1DX35_9CYAN|nr:alpha/beta hydrolase [Stenomitos frigidus]PSB25057.1 alpha/beta hydrolase [Stenomitos frigidus ULC18]